MPQKTVLASDHTNLRPRARRSLSPKIRWYRSAQPPANCCDPNGVGNTFINGVNDKRQMVGFYVDSTGNTDGMLINP